MGIWSMNVPPRPKFDPVINWGHILTAVSFIVFGLGAFFSVKSDLDVLKFRVDKSEATMSSMANVVQKLAEKAVTDAQQSEQIGSLSRRVDDHDRRLDRFEGRPN